MRAEHPGPASSQGGPGRSANGPHAPLPVLFLIADTGGGHRTAARAVGERLELAYPGRFAPVLCDPLGGPGSARLLRWVTGLYGPAVRLAPWLWGAAYYATNLRPAMWLLRRTLLRAADRAAAGAVRAHGPAAIVSFHPLTGIAAVWARDRAAPRAPVVTVVTDLAAMHAAWRYADTDLIIAPPAVAALLTAHIPGQEKGNAEIVTGAGAGLRVPDVRRLVAEIGRLRRDHDAIEAMGAAPAAGTRSPSWPSPSP